MKRFEDKIAIITGGADGIGKATAVKMAAEGGIAIIWDVQEEKGKAVVGKIIANGGKAAFLKINTVNFAEVEAGVKKIVDAFGTIDILINNAGITRDASLKK